MTAGVGLRNPITDTEAKIIRDLASKGFSPREMRDEMRKMGIRRDRETIRMYLYQNQIRIDGESARQRYLDSVRGRDKGGGAMVETYISPFEADTAFCTRWAEVHGERRYTDKPRAAWLSRTTTPNRVAPSTTQVMTTGGVAVYG